jgi:GAF domain-containing protein
MSEDAPFEAGFAALSTYFVGDRTMEETLHRVAALACETVTGTAYAGITMMRNAKPETAVFTDDAAPEIDQAQYDAGSGPCLDAFRTGEIHSIVSTRRDQRWPEFSAACVDHGIYSTLSLPLTVEDETNGALNLYATVTDAYGPDETKTGSLFAAQAAIVLANASAYWGARAKAAQLEEALANRAVIDQAKGIIMSTMRCDADEAFAMLVKQSQQQNRKLREVATEITTLASRRP